MNYILKLNLREETREQLEDIANNVVIYLSPIPVVIASYQIIKILLNKVSVWNGIPAILQYSIPIIVCFMSVNAVVEVVNLRYVDLVTKDNELNDWKNAFVARILKRILPIFTWVFVWRMFV